MAKKPKLTRKQAEFVKGIAEGKTQAEAYIKAYDTKGHLPTVEPEATRTANKPQVKAAIELALEKLNLTPERALKPIDDALNHDELDMRLKGTDRYLKVASMAGKGEGGGTTVNNFGNLLMQQRDKYED